MIEKPSPPQSTTASLDFPQEMPEDPQAFKKWWFDVRTVLVGNAELLETLGERLAELEERVEDLENP